DMGQGELAGKSESYEICFVPDNDYRAFLRHKVEDLDERVGRGNFVLTDGTVVGKHEGYPFYTIGQRKGLGIAMGYPIFVTEIQKEKNRVVLGKLENLSKDGMWVHKLNMVKYADQLSKTYETITKVRYKDEGAPASITQIGD